jgi:hypothetical protein
MMADDYSAAFVLSDESAPDCEGDIVRVRGTEWSRFKKNPAVLLAHDPKVPVGTSRNPHSGAIDIDVDTRRGVVVGTCFFHDVTTEARETAELVRRGILNAASLGFFPVQEKRRPGGMGRDILRSSVFEWSVVGIGCNSGALRSELRGMSPVVAKLLGVGCGCDKCRGSALSDAVAALGAAIEHRGRTFDALAKAVLGPREAAEMAHRAAARR